MNSRLSRKLVAIGLFCGLLSACAGSSAQYPSLSVRDSERMIGEPAPAAPSESATAPVASDEDIGAITRLARAVHESFMGEQVGALRLVRAARGLGAESDVRAQAEVSIASLVSLHGQTRLALAQLDALEAEAATTFAPTDGIGAAQAQIATILSEQDQVLDSLVEELGR